VFTHGLEGFIGGAFTQKKLGRIAGGDCQHEEYDESNAKKGGDYGEEASNNKA
jgi:hypothetical protein